MNPSSIVAVVGLLLSVRNACALPSVEGVVEPYQSVVATVGLGQTGVVWHTEVSTDSESTFFRLHFTNLSASAGAEFSIRVKDRGNQVVLDVPASTFARASEYWTTYLSGTYALVEIENRKAVADAYASVKLADVATERRGGKVLSFQDPNNPKDRPVAYYAANAGITAAAGSVAKLRFEKNNVLLACTGFLISTNLMLTNQHCFDTFAECGTAIAQFGYQEDKDRNLEQGEEFRCEEIKDSDPGLDFTLIKLAGAPGARWGALRWELVAPATDTAIYVVQHPGGEPKRVAVEGCAVKTASAVGDVPGQATDLGHICDTEDGSSGSPVLDMNNRVIALHHLGFSLNDSRWVKENRAVKAALIYKRISGFMALDQ